MEPRFLIRAASTEDTRLLDASLLRFAEQMHDSAGVDIEDALRVAKKETSELLPDGFATAGMTFLVAEVVAPEGRVATGSGPSESSSVGWVWLSANAPHRPGTAWVWDLYVDDAWRGHGVGRALMNAAAESAATDGAVALSLNVFWDNAAARTLYHSLGYRETNVYLRLDL